MKIQKYNQQDKQNQQIRDPFLNCQSAKNINVPPLRQDSNSGRRIEIATLQGQSTHQLVKQKRQQIKEQRQKKKEQVQPIQKEKINLTPPQSKQQGELLWQIQSDKKYKEKQQHDQTLQLIQQNTIPLKQQTSAFQLRREDAWGQSWEVISNVLSKKQDGMSVSDQTHSEFFLNQEYQMDYDNILKNEKIQYEDIDQIIDGQGQPLVTIPRRQYQEQIQQLEDIFCSQIDEFRMIVRKHLFRRLELKIQQHMDTIQYIKNLVAQIDFLAEQLKWGCRRLEQTSHSNKDQADVKNQKKILLRRIQKLQTIKSEAQIINKTKYNQKRNTQDQQKSQKELIHQQQTKMRTQSQMVEKKYKSLLDRYSKVKNIIKSRKQLAANLRRFAQLINNTVQKAAIIQTTTGGFGIASGLALIGGVIFAPFNKRLSLTLTIGGIVGCIGAKVSNIISSFANDSKLHDIKRDITKQLQDMEEGNIQTNHEILLFLDEIKQQNIIGTEALRIMQQDLFIAVKPARVHLMEMKGAAFVETSVFPDITTVVQVSKNTKMRYLTISTASGLASFTTLGERAAVLDKAIQLSAANATTASQRDKVELTGAQVLAIVSGVMSIEIGILDVVKGISEKNTTPQFATKLGKMAKEIDKSADKCKKVFQAMFNAITQCYV